jgi:polysaccharide export outer membrane protein
MKKIGAWLFAAVAICATGVAIGADMLLGPGDVVRISVYGSPDLSLETRVSDSGKISYPLIGEVDVRGLSTAQAETRIAGLLDRGGFVKRPQVNMLVTSFQSQQVSVLGNVNRPGRYPMDGKRNIVDVLALAGGVNADGGDSISVIRQRDGKPVQEMVDLAAIVRSADMAKNFELSGGDVVYVERAPRFYIYGEVQRPGVYRLERNMTVVQALSTGGGLNARGTERGLQVKRRGADGKVKVVNAKLDDLLELDDVVYVKESLF